MKKVKPQKPYPEFPLTAHPAGYWSKKIHQKVHYFGRWDDWQAALAKYQEQRDDLHAGRMPRSRTQGATVAHLCNHFLTMKESRIATNELSKRAFDAYHKMCGNVIAAFGKNKLVRDLRPDDFESLRASLAQRLGPSSLTVEINRVRVLFRHGLQSDLYSEQVKFGTGFKPPADVVVKLAQQQKGERLFEAREIRKMLKHASPMLRAAILLGVNCGFGNRDISKVPITAFDFARGWVKFPRPKTAVQRRCPLWPCTVDAVQEWLAQRPEPVDRANSGLAFIAPRGDSYVRETSANPISKYFRRLLNSLELHREGLGFYALRHTFATVGGDSRDQTAVKFLMGHTDSSMTAGYQHRFEDARLRDVVNHVHKWLWRCTPEQRRTND